MVFELQETAAMKASLIILSFTALPALAQGATSGRTADGCTYKILNGQYLTDCSKKDAPAAAPAAISAESTPAPTTSAPSFVTSYGDVPVRNNPLAPSPSVQTVTTVSAAPAAPSTMNVTLAPPSQNTLVVDLEDSRHRRRVDKLIEQPYVGVLVGATTISASNKGASTGLGVNVGTLLDEHFGVELGYNYARQGLNLGLDQRGSEPGAGVLNAYRTREDANLKAHLLSLEAQGYLTGALRRFRPFLGLGLGWKSSTLSEVATQDQRSFGYSQGTSSLTQTSVGGLGTAGAKLRVGKDLAVAFSFRYFFPFARQSARLEQPAYYGIPGDNPEVARITKADDGLTGSSQYQISGGLQYSF